MKHQEKTTSIGRNDACPCGSGKKYKKCCLVAEYVDSLEDLEWIKIRKTEGEIIDKHLMPYVVKTYSKEFLQESVEDFFLEEELPDVAEENIRKTMFIPWLLFNWEPLIEGQSHNRLALRFLETRGYQLTPYQRQFIATLSQSYYSFYVVLDVVSENSLHLKDILLQTEHRVKEKQATRTLKRGDVIFNRLLSLEGQEISIGMGPHVLPSSEHLELIEYRKILEDLNNGESLTPGILQECEDELRLFYFAMLQDLFDPPSPQLYNTDGEPIEPRSLTFKLHVSPEGALRKLLPLTLEKNPEDILSTAKKTKKGEISELAFSWIKKGNKKVKSLGTTLLGSIKIKGTRLTVNVNSKKRADKIQKLILKYLGEGITYEKTKSHDNILDVTPRSETSEVEMEALAQSPEAQALLRKMSEHHWKEWIKTPLPLLDNKTPRQASQTEEGREQLEALLLDFERKSQLLPDNFMTPPIEDLRKRLGLTETRTRKSA